MNIVKWNIERGSNVAPLDPLPKRPIIPANSVVIIGGRGPIWAYGIAFHQIHGCAAVVATMDLRLGGAVVVASHCEQYKEGDIIPMEW